MSDAFIYAIENEDIERQVERAIEELCLEQTAKRLLENQDVKGIMKSEMIELMRKIIKEEIGKVFSNIANTME